MTSQARYRIIISIVQLIIGAAALFVICTAMLNALDQLIMVTALSGVLLNLLISIQVARRDLLAGLFAALAFGGPALLLALLNLGDALAEGSAKPFLFWILVTIMAITPGMAGAWSVFMFRQQQRIRNNN